LKNRNRGLIYVVGVLVLALGLTMNTKTGMGVSPILSVSYSASKIWNWSFGNTTFVTYCLFVGVEFALRGRNSRWYDLLQLPFSLIFGRLLDLFDRLVTYDSSAHGIVLNLVFLAAAILITGLGITMTVNMQLVPNPGDGIVQAIAEKIGKDQGFTKNCFDLGCVLCTVILSLSMTGGVIGIGIGTILAMLGVGRAVALVNHFLKEKMCRAAGLWKEDAV
jgi:uncharacterized membrane protein YczE